MSQCDIVTLWLWAEWKEEENVKSYCRISMVWIQSNVYQKLWLGAIDTHLTESKYWTEYNCASSQIGGKLSLALYVNVFRITIRPVRTEPPMAELQYSFGRAQLGLNLSNSVAGNENRSLSSATTHYSYTTPLLQHTAAALNSLTIQTVAQHAHSAISRQYYMEWKRIYRCSMPLLCV